MQRENGFTFSEKAEKKGESIHSKLEYSFFMFVNTKSGNGEGAKFLSIGKHVEFKFEGGKVAHLYFYDLFEIQARESGFEKIKKMSEDGYPNLRIIICGGDGTIPWIMTQVLRFNIDINTIVFGIVPIGTGNDFSRSIGWGYKPINFTAAKLTPLANQLIKWMNSTIGKYDMWDVEVETFQNGKIYDIKDQLEIQRNQNSFKKMYSNYVGVGLDARVVYSVERRRTKSACLNKVVYGLIGTCFFFRFMKTLEQTVEEFKDCNQEDEDGPYSPTSEVMGSENLTNKLIKIPSQPLEKIKTKDCVLEDDENSAKYPLNNGYRGIVCLNCPSYMAGLRKVWRTSSVAIESKKDHEFHPQKFDDGVIEFVGYKSEINLALERIIRSGSRITQGGGPFELNFKVPKKDEITFMQIDGESIKIKNLKSVKYTKTQNFPEHQINIMINLEDQE